MLNPVTILNGTIKEVSVTPTVTAGTYGTNKCVGGIMTFSNVLAPAPSGSEVFGGVIESITVKFKGTAVTTTLSVSIFDTSPAGGTYTDNSTAAIAAADTALLHGIYQLSTAVSVLGTHTIYNLDGIGKALVSPTQSLFVVLTTGAAFGGSLASTSDVTVTLGMLW